MNETFEEIIANNGLPQENEVVLGESESSGGGTFDGSKYALKNHIHQFRMPDNQTIRQPEILGGFLRNTEIDIKNTTGKNIFNVKRTGASVGDVTIGDYSGGSGALWDYSAGTLTVKGTVNADGGTIGGFTLTSTTMYGGIIKTAATVGAGSTGVIMDTDGLRGYDSVLGNTFNLPTDGSAPTFASGVINETVFEISTNAILRTSSTVGDGSASSAGVLINNTGVYICEANQAVASANFKALIDGTISIKGSLTITGGSGIANLSDAGSLAVLDNVGASNCDTTIIDGGKIITGLLTADNITAGTMNAARINGGDITGVTITGNTITGGLIRTNSATHPHAEMSSTGFEVNGQYMTFNLAAGTAIGEVYGSSTYGLLMSSFSGKQCYVNGANNLILNAGGGTLQLRHGNTTRAYTSSTSLIISTGMTLGGVRRTTWPSAGVSDHDSLTGVSANDHHSSTSSGIAINPSGISSNGNVAPSSANTRYCGTSGAYWARVYSDAYFTKNTSWQTGWDKYDDLQIIRDLKTIKDKGKNSGYRLDASGLPKEIYDKGFTDFGGLISFNLCASKKIVECVDDLKSTIESLTNRLNNLEKKYEK